MKIKIQMTAVANSKTMVEVDIDLSAAVLPTKQAVIKYLNKTAKTALKWNITRPTAGGPPSWTVLIFFRNRQDAVKFLKVYDADIGTDELDDYISPARYTTV